MLHSLPDWRPDAEDILALAWMEDTASRRTERRQRRKEDTITSLDIREARDLEHGDTELYDEPPPSPGEARSIISASVSLPPLPDTPKSKVYSF